MFVHENEMRDKKSYKFLQKKSIDRKELFLDVVAFANHKGGTIYIGIEDNEFLPPQDQKIDPKWMDILIKKIGQNTQNVNPIDCKIQIAENNGQYIKIRISPTMRALACRNDGVYVIRFQDTNKRIYPEELAYILEEKNNFVWETISTKNRFSDCDQNELKYLLNTIRESDVVDSFIKRKTDREICEHYLLIDDEFLTNLGVLRIGTKIMRARICYPLRLSIVFYDKNGQRTKKSIDYTDLAKSPLEILEEVISLDLRDEGIEISNGMFRKFVNYFPREVIKELVANAICHRNYTLNGDVFVNIYDGAKVEVVSPGSLPYGVTPENILHVSRPRNQHLAELAKATRMMEKLGSGYDKIYEVLIERGLDVPIVKNGFDFVSASLKYQVPNETIVNLLEKINKDFELYQKDVITLGIVARGIKITAKEISQILNVDIKEVSSWIGKLLDLEIVKKKGQGTGTLYFISPNILKKVNHKSRTNLRGIEKHRLKALIYEDLKLYSQSSISDIQTRIGKEIPLHQIRKILNEGLENDELEKRGDKKWTRYSLT